MLTSTRSWMNDPARTQAVFDQAKALLAAGDREGLVALAAERDWDPTTGGDFEDEDE